MTTPQEKLKEIEHENIMSGGDRDLTWLITRVKTLENALELIKFGSVFSFAVKDIARKALEGL